MPSSILAIAIGDPANSRPITTPGQITGARPYIMGLYNHLSQQTGYKLGTDYIIDYRECFEGMEDFTGTHQIIFGMSTPVVRKAKKFTTAIPIVGIFSEHATENFDATPNVCGVNGKRIQNALHYYNCFVQTVTLTQVYILHRDNNTASDKCLKAIKAAAAAPGGLPVPISELTLKTAAGNDPSSDITTLINSVPSGPASGLLVLPVDVFFGFANLIFHLAHQRKLSVSWPSPDWCPPAVCAHGATQEACGELMGAQVEYILDNLGGPSPIPTGAARFVDFPDANINCVASAAVAQSLKITLKKHHGLQII